MFNNRAYDDFARHEREKVNAEDAAANGTALYRETLQLRYGAHLVECLANDIERTIALTEHRTAAPDKTKFDSFILEQFEVFRSRAQTIADILSGKTAIERPAAAETMLRVSERMKAPTT
jgi:hypothetical protein